MSHQFSTILSVDIPRILFIGAGKTEIGKHAMQYLAALGSGSGGVECQILPTNFILEGFGNAKTSRNDNSSRFGKMIEIQFSALGKICGAKIQTLMMGNSSTGKVKGCLAGQW